MATTNDRFFQQLFCLIGEIHHVALKRPNRSSFRGQGRLVHLLAHNGGVSQRELASLAQVKPGSISEVLERLEKEKIVERWRDPADRRVVRVQLTKKGQDLYQANRETRHRFEQTLLQSVSQEEQEAFLTVVQKMQQQLQENYGELLPQKRGETNDKNC